MSVLSDHRAAIRANTLRPDAEILHILQDRAGIDAATRHRASAHAAQLVTTIRTDSAPGLMEVFLAEYGLSTDEGVALMCLAEALLRVPDTATMDALIEDKIAPSAWGAHLGQSSSSLVNASTWALMLTGKVLQDGTGMAGTLHNAIKRVGEPVIRAAIGRAMKELGAQFVLGETIDAAIENGAAARERGYTFSYDMLGEAAMTAADAAEFHQAYATAIAALAARATAPDIRDNPGISIKLSALHPRYETPQKPRVMDELVPRVVELCQMAKSASMGLNIDAEEADRLDLSLDVIEAVVRDPALDGWDGFGVVVQAYGKRAMHVIDWLHDLAAELDRKIMIRLVKGAYWDTEIKRAQVEGIPGFPVFAQKHETDMSYICCARQLLALNDRIYPQFATHNAHSIAAILEMASSENRFEFQRLHGMGEALHDVILARGDVRSRIYAPVGAHRDLLAYLVRRLLENGANSSFVNQIVDAEMPPELIAADPFLMAETAAADTVPLPQDIYQPERINSKGWSLFDPVDLAEIASRRAPFETASWTAGTGSGARIAITNPADPADQPGDVAMATVADLDAALARARPWDATRSERARALNAAADAYEANFGEIFAILSREAGKTTLDAIAELREAVDFLRYYAAQSAELSAAPRGIFACISPWNFPLAIFTGQIAAALAMGNAVIAKPAETTPLIAQFAVTLLHDAGVPETALQILPGEGAVIGAALSADPRIDGICFTGSTATAQRINRAMADALAPDAPLIAETGGINAMIVDSTALPEQAVRDIIASAFQSAGQRCSALRVLYVQEDIIESFSRMLIGAMDELSVARPWDFTTDIGPIIDAPARDAIAEYVDQARAEGRLIHQIAAPEKGSFVGPALLRVAGIADVKEEVFGPVLHLATFQADQIDAVIAAVNATGFGLTFGLHTRIDDRVEQVTSQIGAGNVYVNRNQIGAIVGSQPFGGVGLSGTGPKAGGPHYLPRFARARRISLPEAPAQALAPAQVVARLATALGPDIADRQTDLPGVTGESNRLSLHPRGPVLCLGPGLLAAVEQLRLCHAAGAAAVMVAPGAGGRHGLSGMLAPETLTDIAPLAGVAFWGPDTQARAYARALAARAGAIVPLWCSADIATRALLERHICIDTTAAGGNAALLADRA